jgi:diguanylate cyclase (GGDEF)-like protein
MKYLRSGLLIAYILVLSLLLIPVKSLADEGGSRQYSILFLSSYAYSNASVPPQLEGFENGLEGVNADISYEFMDADKYYGGIDIENFDKYLRYKVFAKRNYDLVVVADDPALRYAINNRELLFPEVPMVFMGVNNTAEAITASAMKDATGIAESPDFENNFKLMTDLFPTRKHLYVIVDSSVAGQGDYVEFMKFKDNHPEISSTIVNTGYYTENGLKELLGSLDGDDIILFLDFTIDGEKNSYSLQNAAKFLSDCAPDVPIFRLASADIEHGVFGGISYSYFDAGRIAGELSKKILYGGDADEMPLVTSAVTQPYFEQGCMDRFGIRYYQLPSGSIVLNEHENIAKFYRENRALSNLVLIIAVLMFAIIAILYNSNIRRKKLIRIDFMTQMPNRKKLMEDIGTVINQSNPHGIIMIDVDYFKDINDTFGHKVGDEIIIGVAERLKEMSDKELTFSRLGGDEFCGLFFNPTPEKGEQICKDVMEMSQKPFKTSSGNLKLSFSVGCAMYPIDNIDKTKVMECADKALYAAKEKGRNGYVLFSGIDKT